MSSRSPSYKRSLSYTPVIVLLVVLSSCEIFDGGSGSKGDLSPLSIMLSSTDDVLRSCVSVSVEADEGVAWITLEIDGDSIDTDFYKPFTYDLNLRDYTVGTHLLTASALGEFWQLLASDPVEIEIGEPDLIPWQLSADSSNFAVLVLNYNSFQFESGGLYTFTHCGGCGADSLPVVVEHNAPMDGGSTQFYHAGSMDLVFSGSIIWMGLGSIYHPTDLVCAGQFETVSTSLPFPDSYSSYCYAACPPNQDFTPYLDTIWAAISDLSLVHQFGAQEYQVGFYLYPPAVGMFHPDDAKWIVFLFHEGEL